jgi:Rieske Fe-S protein
MADPIDRRSFLICSGCAAFAAACHAPEIVPFPTGETGAGSTDPGGSGAGTASDYPCNQTIDPGGAGWTALSLSDYPDLAQVGGWYGSPGGLNIVVAQAEDGCYAAISRPCAHQGALINYNPDRKVFQCPLHGAVYDLKGHKVSGPQPTGLPVYPCGRDGDTVWVKVG